MILGTLGLCQCSGSLGSNSRHGELLLKGCGNVASAGDRRATRCMMQIHSTPGWLPVLQVVSVHNQSWCAVCLKPVRTSDLPGVGCNKHAWKPIQPQSRYATNKGRYDLEGGPSSHKMISSCTVGRASHTMLVSLLHAGGRAVHQSSTGQS